MEDVMSLKRTTACGGGDSKPPESPRLPMEFLSRSWSLPALQLSNALCSSLSLPSLVTKTLVSSAAPSITEGAAAEEHEQEQRHKLLSGNSFSFASSATSQLVLERIMSQPEVSPLTSGRPSCSDPINIGNSTAEMDSPHTSPPRDFDYYKGRLVPGAPPSNTLACTDEPGLPAQVSRPALISFQSQCFSPSRVPSWAWSWLDCAVSPGKLPLLQFQQVSNQRITRTAAAGLK
ncbi:hypothetical protein Nepgr_027637 [Nepenthes gracilis]|uniref:VAN3-binding protein-like auxin canalisation domain-containing protein n=1 Tax=Nepenthes gracilis TaxID=150966 RepID=A0AAD3TAN6_NEPGR|nr:hypothetical protein Nepgr_027637 [Nepenthes gracilis]